MSEAARRTNCGRHEFTRMGVSPMSSSSPDSRKRRGASAILSVSRAADSDSALFSRSSALKIGLGRYEVRARRVEQMRIEREPVVVVLELGRHLVGLAGRRGECDHPGVVVALLVVADLRGRPTELQGRPGRGDDRLRVAASTCGPLPHATAQREAVALIDARSLCRLARAPALPELPREAGRGSGLPAARAQDVSAAAISVRELTSSLRNTPCRCFSTVVLVT